MYLCVWWRQSECKDRNEGEEMEMATENSKKLKNEALIFFDKQAWQPKFNVQEQIQITKIWISKKNKFKFSIKWGEYWLYNVPRQLGLSGWYIYPHVLAPTIT